VQKHTDVVVGNPYLHFIVSEAWGALAATGSYAFFHFGAFAAQRLSEAMPLAHNAPAAFLETILAWGAALSCAATFTVITAYQLVFLIKRQWEKV
jgi:hypothetical protein